MTGEKSRVVVSRGVCDCRAVPMTQARHCAFPEVCGEGDTFEEAASNLVALLKRHLDSAGSHWRRAPIEQAIAEVQERLVSGERPETATTAETHGAAARVGTESR